ncbi:MAG: sulfate ABC transporter permease subunit CysT [Actinomycetota bacterium]|nr:sulfate ABC transporter permease subunit CysT [Actinomycetota bacterium]
MTRRSRRHSNEGAAAAALSLGFTTSFLSVIVILPIAALVWASRKDGLHQFWSVATSPEALAALKLTLGAAVVVSLVNAFFGTITAWVLVRDDFRGKRLVNAVIDLPFALPTIVAGLTLLALYGPQSPIGIDVSLTRKAILLALLFVTLPFVVRTVQPVLLELDLEAEEAARSLGAGEFRVFRSVVLPNILPGILSGVALAFARAVGEIGALVLIAGNTPFKTEVASVFVFLHIQGGDEAGASAVAVVMLAISFALLLAIGGLRFLATRHERA